MKQRNYRNIACVIGLTIGLSMIGAAANVQAAEYLRNEEGIIQYDEDGLPIIEETSVITAQRTPSVMDRIRDQPIYNFLDDNATSNQDEDVELAVIKLEAGV